MQSYVFQTQLPSSHVDNILKSIRSTVQDLKKHHPELHNCSLADVGLNPTKQGVDVTLYFQTTP